MLLSEYTNRLKTLVHDFSLEFYGSPLSTTDIINQARKVVAARTKCIRVLVPSSASVTGFSIVAGGSGYSSPTIALTAPQVLGGIQATASLTVTAGAITDVSITNPGSGYTSAPTGTISGAGSGGSVTFSIGNYAQTVANQEVYNYSSYNSLLPTGAATILGLVTVAVNRGSEKPVLSQVSWAELQARFRAYNTAYLDYPCVWANYLLGENGSFYLWPIPASNYPMDLDVFCSPSPLSSDSSVDLIPYFWSEAVAYYSAYLAYLYSQRAEDATRMMGEYDRLIKEGTAYAQPFIFPSFYSDGYF